MEAVSEMVTPRTSSRRIALDLYEVNPGVAAETIHEDTGQDPIRQAIANHAARVPERVGHPAIEGQATVLNEEASMNRCVPFAGPVTQWLPVQGGPKILLLLRLGPWRPRDGLALQCRRSRTKCAAARGISNGKLLGASLAACEVAQPMSWHPIRTAIRIEDTDLRCAVWCLGGNEPEFEEQGALGLESEGEWYGHVGPPGRVAFDEAAWSEGGLQVDARRDAQRALVIWHPMKTYTRNLLKLRCD